MIKTKGKQGKTKGAFSFVEVSGETLSKFPRVIISRKWAEAVGISNLPNPKSAIETLPKANPSQDLIAPLEITVSE